jgi:hypothetical protein
VTAFLLLGVAPLLLGLIDILGFSGILALFGAMLCGGLGLSLFLVRPLMLLGPRVPWWLLILIGPVLVYFQNSACAALYPDFLDRSFSHSDCEINAALFGIGLFFFGIVLVVRQFQVSRKRQPPATGEDISK